MDTIEKKFATLDSLEEKFDRLVRVIEMSVGVEYDDHMFDAQ